MVWKVAKISEKKCSEINDQLFYDFSIWLYQTSKDLLSQKFEQFILKFQKKFLE